MFYSGSRSKLGKPTVQDGSFSGQNLPQPTAEYNAAYPQTVTLVDGAISQLNDFNENGNNATQGTAANRPVLSRADNKENLQPYSNTPSNTTFWETPPTGATLSANTEIGADGTANYASKITENTANSEHRIYSTTTTLVNGQTYIIILDVKASANRGIRVRRLTGFADSSSEINLQTGAIIAQAGSGFATVEDLGSGWWRIKVTQAANANAAALLILGMYSLTASSHVYLGDGSSTLTFQNISIRRPISDSTYLATTTFPQYAGINGNAVPVFDGSNDSLATTIAVNPTGGMWGAVFVRPNTVHTGSFITDTIADATTRINWRLHSSGRIEAFVFNGNTIYIARYSAASAYTAGESFVLSITYDGTTSATGIKIYKNGVQIDVTTATAGVYTVPTAGAVLSLTGRAGEYFNGYLSPAVFGQGSTWADADRQATEQDLARKYIPNYVWFNPANNVTSDAGAVASWTDVTNTYVASQSTAANRPAVSTLNGQTAFLFDGTNDSLATNLAVNPTGGMAGVVVCRPTLAANGWLYASANSTEAANYRLAFAVISNGQVQCYVFNGSTNHIARLTPTTTVSANTPVVLSFTYDGTTSATGIKIYKNGVQVDTTTNTGGAYTVPTAGTILTIGSRSGLDNFFNGYIADAFFVQGRQMSDSERQGLESRFMTQYGI